MSDNVKDQYRAAARILKESHYTVVFTGAGISTPSGIPDFRSTSTGLWQKNDPMLVASLTAFNHHPDRFYRWLRPLVQASSQAKSNPAHNVIAELEKTGVVQAVITLFEEALPAQAWQAATNELDKAEVVLIAGSSLEVIPASSLPYDAYRHGCRIIIINLSRTYMDSIAEVLISDDVAEALPQIMKNILAEE